MWIKSKTDARGTTRARSGRVAAEGRARGARETGATRGARAATTGEEATATGGAATATREDGDAATREATTDGDATATSARETTRKSDKEAVVLAVSALAVGAEVVALGGPATATATARDALAGAARGLIANHAPGVGGIIEDGFLGLLTVGTVYALWRSSVIPRPIGNPIARKSRTNASWIHVVTGRGGARDGALRRWVGANLS